MGHIDGRRLGLPVESLDLRPHLDSEFGIEIGKGFVHQEDPRAGDQHPGEGDPLLLASAHLLGIPIPHLSEAHIVEGLGNLPVHLLRSDLPDLQTEGHVLPHGHVGPEGVGLENQADPPLSR